VAMTDPSGTVVWRASKTPFGTTTVDEDPDGDGRPVTLNLRFPGQYFDAETGMHYNWHRDYEPGIGRYVEADPIGLKGGVNTYLYAFGNSVIWFDLYGLLSCSYQISAHTLSCTNNAGQSMSRTHVKAGKNRCQDDTSCIAEEDEGPLPPGNYHIHPPGYAPRRPTWLYLQPSKDNAMHGRGGFFIHRWGISNGCITIYWNADFYKVRDWAVQDGGGDLNVTK
jgi:RHS repeat-associated protein